MSLAYAGFFLVVEACQFAVSGIAYTVVLATSEEGSRLKVVIIDDEKAMHFIMKRMLAKLDEIEIVGSSQETTAAYTYLVNYEVDLIFLDIHMPRENGLEFAKRFPKSIREALPKNQEVCHFAVRSSRYTCLS